MDARSRCRIMRGQGPLGKHGRAVRSRVFSLASLLGHWASMEELLEVVSFHLPRYEQTVKTCQNDPGQVNPSNLTFATKSLATYLFIKVKGSRPMTYQYLTVEMVKAAKANGGFIDQKTFNTAGKYGLQASKYSTATLIS